MLYIQRTWPEIDAHFLLPAKLSAKTSRQVQPILSTEKLSFMLLKPKESGIKYRYNQCMESSSEPVDMCVCARTRSHHGLLLVVSTASVQIFISLLCTTNCNFVTKNFC